MTIRVSSDIELAFGVRKILQQLKLKLEGAVELSFFSGKLLVYGSSYNINTVESGKSKKRSRSFMHAAEWGSTLSGAIIGSDI